MKVKVGGWVAKSKSDAEILRTLNLDGERLTDEFYLDYMIRGECLHHTHRECLDVHPNETPRFIEIEYAITIKGE